MRDFKEIVKEEMKLAEHTLAQYEDVIARVFQRCADELEHRWKEMGSPPTPAIRTVKCTFCGVFLSVARVLPRYHFTSNRPGDVCWCPGTWIDADSDAKLVSDARC